MMTDIDYLNSIAGIDIYDGFDISKYVQMGVEHNANALGVCFDNFDNVIEDMYDGYKICADLITVVPDTKLLITMEDPIKEYAEVDGNLNGIYTEPEIFHGQGIKATYLSEKLWDVYEELESKGQDMALLTPSLVKSKMGSWSYVDVNITPSTSIREEVNATKVLKRSIRTLIDTYSKGSVVAFLGADGGSSCLRKYDFETYSIFFSIDKFYQYSSIQASRRVSPRNHIIMYYDITDEMFQKFDLVMYNYMYEEEILNEVKVRIRDDVHMIGLFVDPVYDEKIALSGDYVDRDESVMNNHGIAHGFQIFTKPYKKELDDRSYVMTYIHHGRIEDVLCPEGKKIGLKDVIHDIDSAVLQHFSVHSYKLPLEVSYSVPECMYYQGRLKDGLLFLGRSQISDVYYGSDNINVVYGILPTQEVFIVDIDLPKAYSYRRWYIETKLSQIIPNGRYSLMSNHKFGEDPIKFSMDGREGLIYPPVVRLDGLAYNPVDGRWVDQGQSYLYFGKGGEVKGGVGITFKLNEGGDCIFYRDDESEVKVFSSFGTGDVVWDMMPPVSLVDFNDLDFG
jgi:hypothetical protein